MDLEKLKTFIRVAEAGSLSAAARHLHTGASALSRQIAALEAEVQGRLLHRTGRGVELTVLGERVLPRARALVEDAAALEAEIAAASGDFRGIVRVAVVPALAGRFMTRIVQLAKERYPEVVLHISVGWTALVEQWVAEGSADLAFALRQEPVGEQVPLGSSRICLVGRPGDHLCSRPEVRFEKLDGLRLVRPGARSDLRRTLGDLARERGLQFSVVAEVDSQELTVRLVRAGVGYALMTEQSVHDDLKDGRVSAARIVEPDISVSFYLVASTHKTASLAGRELSRFIRGVAPGLAAVDAGA